METIRFSELTTSIKSMETVNSDERFFEGLLTVQMKDKQGEVTIVDELYKVLPVWMDRGAPITDTHSNRVIGKGINYALTSARNPEGDLLPAIKITGKIYKNYELDNLIWEKIKNGEYKGLSFGGATRSQRTPMKMKDGSMAYALKDLEHYEVAVCKDPAVPMAIITDVNNIAKADFNATERGDGKMVIRCTKMGCFVEKSNIIKCGECGYDLTKSIEKGNMKVCPNCGLKPKGGVKNWAQSPKNLKRKRPMKEYTDEEKRAWRRRRDAKSTAAWADKLINQADLNESQTFEQKVQALQNEGKPRKNAERIVGSFVKRDSSAGEKPENDDEKEDQNLSEINETTKGRYGGELYVPKRGHKVEESDKKSEKEEKKKEGDNSSVSTDDGFNARYNDKEKEDEKDHSDSDGDQHSMFNQDVDRDASSGRKITTINQAITDINQAVTNINQALLVEVSKADTTVNQTGGVRNDISGINQQGSLDPTDASGKITPVKNDDEKDDDEKETEKDKESFPAERQEERNRPYKAEKKSSLSGLI